jgi:hypothetical protein
MPFGQRKGACHGQPFGTVRPVESVVVGQFPYSRHEPSTAHHSMRAPLTAGHCVKALSPLEVWDAMYASTMSMLSAQPLHQ